MDLADKEDYGLTFLFEGKDYRLEFLVKGDNVHNIRNTIAKQLGKLKERVSPDVERENDDCFRISFAGKAKDIDAIYESIRKAFPVFVPLVDELGDAIRENAYPVLGQIEQTLRSFVGFCLIDQSDFDWKEHGNIKMVMGNKELPCHPLELSYLENLLGIFTVKYSRRRFDDYVSYGDLMSLCSECGSLQELSTKLEENTKEVSLWEEVFSRFVSEDELMYIDAQLKENLLRIRNAVMHHRPVRLHYLRVLNKINETLESAIGKSRAELSRDERHNVGNAIADFTTYLQASLDRSIINEKTFRALPYLHSRSLLERFDTESQLMDWLRVIRVQNPSPPDKYYSYRHWKHLVGNNYGDNDNTDENDEEDLGAV